MIEDELNRIGILLNFFAGFLLSPALLGLERLRHIEKWTERKLSNFRDRLSVLGLKADKSKWAPERAKGLRPLFVFAFLALMFWAGTVGIGVIFFANPPSTPIAFTVKLVFFGVPCAFLLMLAASSTFAALFEVADQVVASLEGDNRLASLLTVLGIIFFIFGNALQLWATFHPGRLAN